MAHMTPAEMRTRGVETMPEREVRVEPFDQFNQELVANVHPAGWVNPEPRERYHLVVIGAGTAGLVTASIAAGLGARVALVERHLMGGDCLNVGCVPSKGIISAARSWQTATESGRRFGGPAVSGPGDFGEVMARMRRLRAGLSRIDGAPRFRDLGVDVFLGEGRFTGRDSVTVGGRALRFRRAVIATGARAAAPPIPGLEATGYLTNETIFGLTELPRRLTVIGAGPIGCELAQAFARLGSAVTVIDRGAQILPREDADAAQIVERAMESHGVRLLHAATVVRAEVRGGERVIHVQVAGRTEEIAGDALLVATGRAPNVEDLGLDAAGVTYSPRGVGVNDRFRTSNPRVFAVGDICSKYQFTHAADASARLVVANALFFGLGGGKASQPSHAVGHVHDARGGACRHDGRRSDHRGPPGADHHGAASRGGPGGAGGPGGRLSPGATQAGDRPHPWRHPRGRTRGRHDRRDRAGDHGRRRPWEDRVDDSSLSHTGRGLPEGGGCVAADEADAEREAGVQSVLPIGGLSGVGRSGGQDGRTVGRPARRSRALLSGRHPERSEGDMCRAMPPSLRSG